MPEETLRAYTDRDGRLDPRRAALHDRIVAEHVRAQPPLPEGTKPRAILMMGGPGSGKSTLLDGMELSSFVRADPDAVKEQLPEYTISLGAGALDAAAITAKESLAIADRIVDEARRTRRNVVFDGTGRRKDRYARMIADLQGDGYAVQLILADVGWKEAERRLDRRARETGRVVPRAVAREIYAAMPGNASTLSGDRD
jgi:predicted ABC-type ATPase